MNEKLKKQIDEMSAYDIAKIIRFADSNSPFVQGDTYEYMMKRFKELGGMTPGISKTLGW